MAWSLEQLADLVSGQAIGDASHEVDSVATLKNATGNQLSFLSNKKYKKHLQESDAGIVVIQKEYASQVKHNAIVVNDPYVAYAMIADHMYPTETSSWGIHSSAVVDTTAEIHSESWIGPNVVIEAHVTVEQGVIIGPNCIIQKNTIIKAGAYFTANVTICHGVIIGERCRIHPGVVIGADGFGIANTNGKWIKIPQVGGVRIGDDVEIGANTTIDRGAIEDTIIGNGVKLDNQIQVGHNTIIGDNTVIAGCVGIAGSTTIGNNCAIGGGAGLGGHLEIADGVQLTGMTMVTKSITEPGSYSSGIPAEPTHLWHKNVIRYRQLEKVAERIKKLENS
jgi:UDP-3-O-[3-hydroxymyristoyl] glucosamine N-acyltransferase